jgi:hypothetical protein
MGRKPEGRGSAVPWMFLTNSWRAQWRSLLVLALMVGLTGGFAAAAIAGARRSASSPSRFREAGQSLDVFVSGADDRPEPLDRLLEGPLVDDHLDLVFVFAFTDLNDSSFVFAPTDGGGLQIERGVLLDGRRADPTDPHELVLSEVSARRYGVGPGDTLELMTLSPEQAKALLVGTEPTSFDGPKLAMRVVGVARTGFDLAARPDEPTPVVLTPAFLQRYRDTVGLGTASHMVRLVETPDAIGRFTDAVKGAYAGTTQPGLDVRHGERVLADSISVITAALVALALVIAIAGVAWAAAAGARQQRLSAGDLEVLRVLGSTPAARRMLIVGTVAPALLAGVMVAAVVATALSPLFPVGLARRFDPDPGLHADVTVLVAGSLLLLLVLGAAATISGARLINQRARPETGPLRAPGPTDRAARWLRPAPATGLRFALFAPRTLSVPVRPALVGACMGILGLVGVAVVGTSLDRLVGTSARWGTPWDLVVIPDQLDRERVLDDRDIGAAAVGRFDEQVELDGHQMVAMTLDPVKGDLTPTVIDGRAPRSGDEVAVGRDTLDDLGISIGALVDAAGRSSAHEKFRVVGVVLFPTIEFSSPLADGAAFTLDGGNRLKLGDPNRDDAGSERLLIRWAAGVDHNAARRRLEDGTTAAELPIVPPEVNGLRDVKLFPAAAAAGLVVLGVISTSHALAVTVRRRRVELGVLSALGFTPRQRRQVIAAQATTIACVALVVGIPLGVMAGRVIWSMIARSMGVATDAAFPLGLIVVGSFAVIVVLNLIAAIPARSAGRLPVTDALRSE